MSELVKLVAATGLLAAGFFSASLFGAPDASPPTGGQALDEWTPERLVPTDAQPLSKRRTPPARDGNLALATHVGDSQGGTTQVDRLDQPPPGAWPWSSASVNNSTDSSWGAASQQQPAPAFGRDDGFASPPIADSRLASLSPPPLMPAPTESQGFAAETAPLIFPEAPTLAADNSSWHNPAPPAKLQPMSPAQQSPANDNWTLSRALPNTAPTEINTWHRVSDGDSLVKIAARYLHDESRAGELYDLNRNVLSNPDLLPIGVELRIPARGLAPHEVQVFDASGAASGRFQEQRLQERGRLVPLPTLPASVNTAPRARLGSPQPVGYAGGG